jgi:hypothetical protein
VTAPAQSLRIDNLGCTAIGVSCAVMSLPMLIKRTAAGFAFAFGNDIQVPALPSSECPPTAHAPAGIAAGSPARLRRALVIPNR